MYPSIHVHIGIWLCTLHKADVPHDPGQGSWHFEFIQAWLVEQSAWMLHSGRQFGGLPIKFGRQEHDGEFPI